MIWIMSGIDYLFSVDGGGTNSAPHLCRRGCVADDSECHMIVRARNN